MKHARANNAADGERPLLTGVAREYLLAAAAGLVLYVVCVAPGPLWQDSGLAQLRVLARDLHGNLGLALAHPLYYVLAIAFQVLPFAESAYKTNLVSAVFGAITVANVFLLLRLMTARRGPAIIGAASLAVAHTFWQHCELAEVYTVSTALLGVELLCLRRFLISRNARWLVLLYLANGVGASNHLLALLSMACYGTLTLYLLARRQLAFGVFVAAALAWLSGAALYLGMIVGELAAGAPWMATLRSATVGGFSQAVTNVLPTIGLLKNSVLYLGLNFPTPTAVLGAVGIVAAWRARVAAPRPFQVVLLALLAIHLLWAVRYKVTDQYTFFIPAVVLIAVFIGLGADQFLTPRRRRWATPLTLAALLPVAVYVAAPTVLPRMGLRLPTKRVLPYRDDYAYFLQPWQSGYDGPARFAAELHALLPEPSVLVTDATAARPLEYWKATGRWTRDIRIVRYQERDPGEPEVTEAYLADDLAAGRVYVVTAQPRYAPPWLIERYECEPFGPIWHVVGRREE